MSETKYMRKDVTGAKVESDLILFDPLSGKYFATGEVGAEVWGHLEKEITLTELCNRMAKDYEVDEEICRKDVLEFVNKLRASGLVVEADSS